MYRLKRYVLSFAKSLETGLKTWERKKEIDKAYGREGFSLRIRWSFPALLWLAGSVAFIALIVLGVSYREPLLASIAQLSKLATQEKQELTESKTPQKEIPQEQPVEVVQEKPEPKEKVPPATPDPRAVSFPREMDFFILANKANDTMYFLANQGSSWSIKRTYHMAHGARNGRKMRAGDKKTPEGLYFIIGRKERRELHNQYGPLAFVLNYPNEIDKREGRTGNGIWIHGTNPDSIPIETRGCLELNNDDLIELGTTLKSGVGVPVHIISKDSLPNPEIVPNYKAVAQKRKTILSAYQAKSSYFIAILDTWQKDWETRNIDHYSRHYHPEKFFSQGMHWEEWKTKKAATFTMYSMINISIDNIFLADFTDSTAVLKFFQTYESNRFKTTNGKRLLLVKSDSQWKICQESSIPKEELLL